jgi:hypothetical protein
MKKGEVLNINKGSGGWMCVEAMRAYKDGGL